jgi:pimeloyl-ACP methyl ester carboxylesterase
LSGSLNVHSYASLALLALARSRRESLPFRHFTRFMGTALHIETVGEGVPVHLLHSSGLSGRQWKRLAGRLAGEGFSAIVPDLTGHGASPPWLEPVPFSYRDDVDLFVETLKAGPPVHVVGHSYGGLVAILAALEVPDAVRSLVLFEPVAMGVLDALADADAKASLEKIEVPWGTSPDDHEGWLRAFVDYWGGTGAWDALREEARAEFRRVGWVVKEEVTTLGSDRTPRSAYGIIRCPVTLLTGELSPLAAGRVVTHLAAALPNAHVITLPGAGHMAPLAQAATVNDLIVAALSHAMK